MGRCICSRNQGGKKLITKNETCAPLAAVLGTLGRNFEKKVSSNFCDHEER